MAVLCQLTQAMSDEEIRKHFHFLLNKVNQLESSIQKQMRDLVSKVNDLQISASNNGLKVKVGAIENKVKDIEGKMSIFFSRCQLSDAKKLCGQCRCVDDRNLDTKYYCDCQNRKARRDCLEHRKAGETIDGIYLITMNNIKTVQVFCDQTTDGGGWTVIQRRVDGSINFDVDWNTYKSGFGQLNRDFYLGNENIFYMSHQALIPHGSELRVELLKWNGQRYFAKYKTFQVENESQGYRLHVDGYSGNAGDALKYHDGMKFSTYDRDNDEYPQGNCAASSVHAGGWWHNHCVLVHLNGIYYRRTQALGKTGHGICWQGNVGYTNSLQFVEMKMRRKL